MKIPMYSSVLILLEFLLSTTVVAQNFTEAQAFLRTNCHWAFGESAGLNFSSGTAVSVTSAMIANEGPSAVSDPVTGDLLFYTNGETVWNAQGNIMQNGDSLLGNSNYSYLTYSAGHNFTYRYGNMSTSQGTCIVPVIGEVDKYYLFSLVAASVGSKYFPVDHSLGSLFYSVVDMSLDGRLGGVVSGLKNQVLTYDTLAEAMIAIPGENCDVWLLVHSRTQRKMLAYRITVDGIDTTPVVSVLSALLMPSRESSQMTLAVSPDRRRLARKGGLFLPSLIAHFDPATGQVSNAIQLAGNNWGESFGVAFSPDNSKLYMEDSDYGLGQFDISVYDSAAIASSLMSLVFPFSQGHLRLYNDTIYFRNGSGANASYATIHRINQPNLSGTACDIQFNALQLLPGTTANAGFGNDVVFPMPADSSYSLSLDTLICSNSEITLTPPQTLDTIQWNDGSRDATLSVMEAGVYWVQQSNGCHYRVDTFIIEVMDFPEPMVVADGLELRVSGSYDSYQWLLDGNIIPNATGQSYTAQVSGDYQVIAGNAEGCVDTSVIYKVESLVIQGQDDNTASITVYPNPVDEVLFIQSPAPVDIQLSDVAGRKIMELHHTRELPMKTLPAGVYMLQVKNSEGLLLRTLKVVKR